MEIYLNNWEHEVKHMNKLFKGTAQDYLRARAKKHRLCYNNSEGCQILNTLADGIDLVIAENTRLKRDRLTDCKYPYKD